jgi:hypothetical protein
MLPSETMIWQPEFTDKILSRKPGAVHNRHFVTIKFDKAGHLCTESAPVPHWSPSSPLNCRIRLLHSAFPGIKSLSLSATIRFMPPRILFQRPESARK